MCLNGLVQSLRNAAEVQQCGFNRMTAIAVCTVLLSAVWAYVGLGCQILRVRRTRSGASVNQWSVALGAGYFTAFGVFAVRTEPLSIVLLWNSLTAIPCCVLLWYLHRYKGLNHWDRRALQLVIIGMTFVMGIVPAQYLSHTLAAYYGALGIGMILQVAEQLRTRATGALSPVYLIVSIGSNICWAAYAQVLGNKPILLFCILAGTLNSTMLILWQGAHVKERDRIHPA